ncbi:acyl-homoserine-lactone synthase [Variovorax paradoxus]|uniref:acyl-homoserine-lactone synthase n=1 Tax=Variovorax paradoxus TaxID=34073 RepID=UPI00247AD0B6
MIDIFKGSAIAVEILIGKQSDIAADVMRAIGRYRHQVFIEKLGWDLASRDGLEFDQFDHAETLYVAARDATGEIVGTARLLPTDRPYLLGEVFPQLMGEGEPPRDPRVWELSRFAATDVFASSGDPLSQFSSEIGVELLEAVLAVAARHGVRQLITVSPLGIERLLRRHGFEARRAASPQIVGGKPVFACWIEVGHRLENSSPEADSRQRVALLDTLRESMAQEAGMAA